MLNLIKSLEETKKELEHINSKYERLAKTLPAILYEYVLFPDGSNKCIYVSPKCEEILGLPQNSFLEDMNNFWNLVHKEDLTRITEADKLANKDRTRFFEEIRIFRPDTNEIRWLQLSSLPSEDTYEGHSIWSGFIFDITDKKILEEKLTHYATIDSLTEIYNRRHFYENVKKEIEKFKKFQTKFSLLLLDLDKFKSINDKFGHIIGDETLKHFVKETSKLLRPKDYFGRIGGEEFCILFGETTFEEAKKISHLCRELIEKTPISTDLGDIYLTISGGLVEIDHDTLDILPLIEKADKALYTAKQSGRNKIVHL